MATYKPPVDSDETSLNGDAGRKSDEGMNDERRSSVPRLTGSSTTDCDAQSKESASHIDECTEQEMPSLTESCSSQNPSPITDDEEMSQPVQETEHDANEESELVLPQDLVYPCKIQCLQRSSTMDPLRFTQGSTVVRPWRHPEVLYEWQRELVRYAITGQYEKLLKGILKSPPCSQTCDTICLDLGKGHKQIFPLFSVSQKGADSLLQLALEGVLMAENASENLELLRKNMPGFPYPLYLLYRAKLASAACSMSECQWVLEECQALLCRDVYNQGKYHSWIINALGQTVRHVENNDDGWDHKARCHIAAYDERNCSNFKDDLDIALCLLDLTKTKQSHSLAIAYKGTEGNFFPDEKAKFNSQAKNIHDEAMSQAQELLNLLGMKSDPDGPSNLMISLRYDGTLRTLRIEQIKMLTVDDPLMKKSMIEQHVKHIEGENTRMGDILGNCCLMVDEDLLQKMTKRFNETLKNVRKGKIKFYTLDDVRTSE